jgi:hypothetical protein
VTFDGRARQLGCSVRQADTHAFRSAEGDGHVLAKHLGPNGKWDKTWRCLACFDGGVIPHPELTPLSIELRRSVWWKIGNAIEKGLSWFGWRERS